MVLVDPRDSGHVDRAVAAQSTDGRPVRPLRIGIINIMPRAEAYEPYVLAPLERSLIPVKPTWIRLRTHRYGSSDADRIRRGYVDFGEATRHEPLDGLIVTGAPVEELAFHEVHYWDELSDILRDSRSRVASTLGLCWGGLALAKLLGIDKSTLERKLFGVFLHTNLLPTHALLEGADDEFWCAHSRHSGIDAPRLEAARDSGVVRLLAHGSEAGHSIFESADGRYVMHLGHPEYETDRIVHEWERDRAQGRADVDPPAHFNLAAPVNVWRSHRNDFFSQWLRRIAQASFVGRLRPDA